MRDTETLAEREAGSMQEPDVGLGSWDSRITPWVKGRCSIAEPPRRPSYVIVTAIFDDMTSFVRGNSFKTRLNYIENIQYNQAGGVQG